MEKPSENMMKLRVFVSGAAAVFAAWLTLTFVRDLPRDHYPEVDHESVTASATVEGVDDLVNSGRHVADQVITSEPAVAMD